MKRDDLRVSSQGGDGMETKNVPKASIRRKGWEKRVKRQWGKSMTTKKDTCVPKTERW